ncbi:MAG: alpha/beta hydrolase [Saprospiraceae bacterium]|nr:alpha/beta hydrolase [Saprospiraceae bacterium]
MNRLLGTMVFLLLGCYQQISAQRFVVTDTSLFTIPADQSYTFGYLEVPENRSKADSRTIRLPVYIFKSRHPNPKADPIIYTVGGPGASTMPSAPYMKYYSYLDDRDFILIEQRGTRYAQPNLACAEWAEAQHRSQMPGVAQQQADSLLEAAATACRQRLIGQGIDLNGYRTTEIAADIEALRKALKLEQYNLLTISYSTKIAQVLMRDFPKGIRSVVMDSALPLEVSYDEESVSNLLKSIDQLLTQCEHKPACEAAFPDLKARFFKFLEQITRHPLILEIPSSDQERQLSIPVTGKDLVIMLGDVNHAEVLQIPYAINQVLAGDYRQLIQYLSERLNSKGNGDGIGMRLSVWCAEEYPFTDQAVVAEESQQYEATKGLSPAVFSADICKIWAVQAAPAIDDQAVSSEIPVLFINGGFDYNTPVWWAQQMRKNFPNSFQFIFPNWSHTPTTNWGNSCAMEVALAFFNNPTKRPNLSCLEELSKNDFRTKD